MKIKDIPISYREILPTEQVYQVTVCQDAFNILDFEVNKDAINNFKNPAILKTVYDSGVISMRTVTKIIGEK